ncbi:hypothetical protein ND861_01415 [Leptospira sp. 2 VSF19]|uniref:DUF485 domain-containing protein n=1 Tax=Leptospira soteropolitanensis TaxID=2950025 RepID=A0AAW5V8X1_9LEPT|nr:hypothetical protein [Leptospira soteropolitanensis]MCW7491304.1 hypothetical protein [Leptospira soteropolitanensis]MCW7498889.1 hypothetical protein [Leptospira soteropolitanensis]MCW7521519.1 hypothetical protein [Leptospira soteropolitanensis]MCW7524992.1 hypothetical protein [Leptospira soteropolitanensis]MCW7528860.1 hypothetical protein [Leptospira soteropolitanensis]
MKSKVKERFSKDMTVFKHPDPFLKNSEAPAVIRFRVLGQILPLKYLFSSVGLSFLLFMIPIGTIFLSVFYNENTGILLPILISSSLFFCFYSLVLGFLLLNTRIPFLNEWKEKLGFEEV